MHCILCITQYDALRGILERRAEPWTSPLFPGRQAAEQTEKEALSGKRMEVQFKKGILDALILAVLREGDSYGYKIVQDVSRIMYVSESTLYPILRRLESAGFLRTYQMEYHGRMRKYYGVTPRGLGKLNSFVEEWKDLMKVYDFILYGRV